ncbi:HAD-IA family hydrolase [Halopseudomonas nanhaiensis]|uniref:HAD-IA family hydrolase n=1 Tax=Halopseudomonas nanhaiensis TaxID=2830842 RepID=UPI001CBF06E8|nr:HAD-IA family hydrolase [Halopseudomonas nanhaiensis]UAW97344.1 HAD-IA family hydrolase [Halopseudomonas nanhaiensis]
MLTSVLFDLDGTLLDTAGDFMAIIQAMRADRGLCAVDPERVRPAVSNGSVGMICAAFDIRPDQPGFDELRDDFLNRYEADLALFTRPFPGISPLLDWLDDQQLPWGVVTNKLSRFSMPLMEEMGLARRCSALVCPDQVTMSKPHPEPVLKACSAMRVEPKHSVFIGDHLRDIQAGRAAGMPTVAALYGYLPIGDDPALWEASHSVTSAADLRPWLEQRLKEK